MPADFCTPARLRLVLAPALFIASALALTAGAQPPDSKKPTDPPAKADAKNGPRDPSVVKLPDGTYLWLGAGDGSDERVTLTPAELQKLLDQIEQLKKQLAARKATAPSGCAVRGKVEKRGEQLVAVLKLTSTFRTTAPQTAVALGGRRGFLVAAALDGTKLPVLETTDDGFAVLVETAGDHTLALELEAPVTSRGAKPELGFEIGLPRAPITTLLFHPPGPDVKRVNLTTRMPPDPGKAVSPEPRRTLADVAQLVSKPENESGYALGPVDSLEVTWDPPATAAQPADQVQSAELDVTVLLTEGVVETTAKIKLRGPAREWKMVAPVGADFTIDRAPGAPADVGPALSPSVTKPDDPNKPVWKISLPAGSSAADWVVTAVTRLARPKPEEAKHRGPFQVGPFTTLEVLRQSGTIKVTAGPHTRFAFKHGPDLRRAEPTEAVGDEVSAAFFRLVTGPTGTNPVNTPMFSVEAATQRGDVAVKPTYGLTLTDAGWRVRTEVKVFPIRTEVDAVAVEVPADWRGLEVSPPELVEGVQPGNATSGFWLSTAARLTGTLRVPVVVRLASGQKQPFDLVLTAVFPVEPGDQTAVVPLPRFPGAFEKEAAVIAAVPEGREVRGELRGWDTELAPWGDALAAVPGVDGKTPRVATSVTAKTETGIARVLLGWNPHRPDLVAEVRADVVLGERQLEVTQRMTLRSAEGFPHQVRLTAQDKKGTPVELAGLRTQPALTPSNGDWLLSVGPDAKEVALTATFAIPLPPRAAEGTATWRVPVGLLWPAGASRADATVRVWSNAATGRALATSSSGWREVASESSPDRDSLPALSLTSSGAEVPLALELAVREVENPAAVTVWVDRSLVQAWAAGDGATEYRARFLVRRWLAAAIDVRLPGPLAGPNPEFRLDGLKVNTIAVPNAGVAERTFRVPLPASGKAVAVEVRYQLPAAPGRAGEAVYLPPLLPAAAFTGPVRWQVKLPAGAVPLLTGGGTAEFRWRLGTTGLAPSPLASADGMERWFQTGEDPGGEANAEDVTARQAAPGPVRLYRVPRTGLVILCSVVVFVLLLVLSRLPGWAVGPVVAVVGGAVGVTAVMLPHPAAHVAGAAQPGLAGAAVVLLALALARLSYRRRVSRLPGFARSIPTEPAADAPVIPSSARKRASVVGSSGAAPVTPAGG